MFSPIQPTSDQIDPVGAAAAKKLSRMLGRHLARYQSIDVCYQTITNTMGLRSLMDALNEEDELNQLALLGYISKGTNEATSPHDDKDSWRPCLDELDPEIKKVVEGEITFQSWQIPSTVPVDARPHIRDLRIPALTNSPGHPELLLHNLGSFRNDPYLQARVETFLSWSHRVFINSAGSGKTRLMLEALCQRWGLYFSFSPALDATNNLGSSDLWKAYQNLCKSSEFTHTIPIDRTDPLYGPSLARNEELAALLLTTVFLARLMIFSRFLRHIPSDQRSNNIYKARWTAIQVQPCLISRFGDIFIALCSHLCKLPMNDLQLHCEETAASILELLSPEERHLTVVIDEAQLGATLLPSAFRSAVSSVHRPLLRQVIESWSDVLQNWCPELSHHFTIIGPALSTVDIREAIASSTLKNASFTKICDTGCFDDRQRQLNYVLQFVPDTLKGDERFIVLYDRLWLWLRGRHRFTSSFVCLLLAQGFQEPLDLFNKFVEHVGGFTPTDLHPKRQALPVDISAFATPLSTQFDQLDQAKKEELRDVAYKYFLGGTPAPFLSANTAGYLELGIARFSADTRLAARIDEPLILIAAVAYNNQLHTSPSDRLSAYVCRNFRNSPSDSTFKEYVAFYLASELAVLQRLGDLFEISGGNKSLESRYARLVAIRDLSTSTADQCLMKGTWNIPGFNNHGLPEYGGLLASQASNSNLRELSSHYYNYVTHRRPDDHIGIFYPEAMMGPSILFLVELDNLLDASRGPEYLWIAVKVAICRPSRLTRSQTKQCVDAVTPEYFFKECAGSFGPEHRLEVLEGMIEGTPEPNVCREGGLYNVLRVLAGFPEDFQDAHRMDDDEDGHPLATLRLNRLKSPSQSTNPEQFVETMETWLNQDSWHS